MNWMICADRTICKFHFGYRQSNGLIWKYNKWAIFKSLTLVSLRDLAFSLHNLDVIYWAFLLRLDTNLLIFLSLPTRFKVLWTSKVRRNFHLKKGRSISECADSWTFENLERHWWSAKNVSTAISSLISCARPSFQIISERDSPGSWAITSILRSRPLSLN